MSSRPFPSRRLVFFFQIAKLANVQTRGDRRLSFDSVLFKKKSRESFDKKSLRQMVVATGVSRERRYSIYFRVTKRRHALFLFLMMRHAISSVRESVSLKSCKLQVTTMENNLVCRQRHWTCWTRVSASSWTTWACARRWPTSRAPSSRATPGPRTSNSTFPSGRSP